MTVRGELQDTYVAALQHDLFDLDGDEHLIGVVRRPLPWLHGQVDENYPALGPPPDLLDEFKDRYDELRARGVADSPAHNQALEDVNYNDRYRSYIDESVAAQDALQQIESLLDRGEDVVLVCYENTDEKRCHRTLLHTYFEQGMR